MMATGERPHVSALRQKYPLPKLRGLREDRMISQRELSERSGVSADTISRLENGTRQAYPQTIRKLAAALSVDWETLRGNANGGAATGA